MIDYSKMSDFEINKRVFKLMMTGRDWDRQGKGLFDYCNSPADAWPIIAGNEISINYWRSGVLEADRYGVHTVKDKNPLRAAITVFLMMKDAEKC
ncbi:TPA: phage protein NinX family protein [Serratia marcescens]